MIYKNKIPAVVAGHISCDEEMEVFRIPTPGNPDHDYRMLAAYSIDGGLSFRDFENLIQHLRREEEYTILKKLRKYVTHLKRAYLEYTLTDIAAEKLKESALPERKKTAKSPYHRAGRRIY